ncbi:MAG: NAD(P)/FAD-dependent oxidoreductase [Prevotella sp.]|nr:NAD(P)/FAD-dependent oxidoreductase [Prevotella sp.]
MRQSVVVIGAGLGGLFTGAFLAKEGFRVTMLEKNATIGGGLQTFQRFGETFDTGMHVLGGMYPGGNVRKICNYLGIFDRLRLRDVDDDCTDSMYFAEDKKCYTVARDKEGFASSLASYFPHESDNLRRYVDALFSLTDKVDLFNLRPSNGQLSLFTGSDDFLMSAEDFIAQYIGDEKLRSVLAFMNPLYGGRKGQTPAYIHAIISSLYIKGTCRFVDGSSHMADLLAEVIAAHGGEVLTNEPVEWIEVNDRKVDYVRTKNDRQFTADYYISAIHPCTMFQLMDEGALPRAYRNRLNSIPNAHSAFSLFIKLKPNSFPYINHSEYYMTRYEDVWEFSRADKPWPLGFLFMTPPSSNQGMFSSKALVTAPMPFEMVSRWEATKVGCRGNDYDRWKQEKAHQLLKLIEEIHPGFEACIDSMNAASPLTIRDYYGAKDGTICGFSKDCRNIALSQVPVVTKIRNLLLTGQNNNLHGICGVPLTAINTCEAILGNNYIINKINAWNED